MRERPTALGWAELVDQFANRHTPVGFTWQDEDEGLHMMVAAGYTVSAEQNLISVFDPWPACTGDTYFIDADIYDQEPGHHTHVKDYYDLAVEP